jgi:hypothetical protein
MMPSRMEFRSVAGIPLESLERMPKVSMLMQGEG